MTTALGADTHIFAWRVEQGERTRITIPILDSAGDPYDVTGWAVDAQIKAAPGGCSLYTWPAELITIDGAEVELVIPAAVSSLWTWTSGWWRVVITDPNSNPADLDTYRVIQGDFTLLLD